MRLWAAALVTLGLLVGPAAAQDPTPTGEPSPMEGAGDSPFEHVVHVHDSVMDHGGRGALWYREANGDPKAPLVPSNEGPSVSGWLAAGGLLLAWPWLAPGARALWLRLGRTGALGLFFSRYDPERALDHPRRRALVAALVAEPGVHVETLRRRLGWANGVFQHHLAVLASMGQVRKVRDRAVVRLFPAGTEPEAGATVQGRILAAVDALPGSRPVDLARRVGVSVNVLRYHALRLVRQGRLDCRPDGRTIRYFPTRTS